MWLRGHYGEKAIDNIAKIPDFFPSFTYVLLLLYYMATLVNPTTAGPASGSSHSWSHQ